MNIDDDAPKHSPDEMHDISEDVGSDFFAVHEKREEGRRGQDSSHDKSYDPFFTVRDAFEPNDETEKLVQNFSIVNPSFKDLDARNDEQTLNGTFEEDKKNLVKDVPLEEFGVQAQKEKEEFSEALEFGAPKAVDQDDGFDVASTFTTEKPRFERSPLAFFAGEKPSAQKPQDGQKSQEERAKTLEASSAIPISGQSSFMFSSFGQNSIFKELQKADSNAITQGADGVFSIAGDLETSDFVQDNSFKRLVDSVLNNA